MMVLLQFGRGVVVDHAAIGSHAAEDGAIVIFDQVIGRAVERVLLVAALGVGTVENWRAVAGEEDVAGAAFAARDPDFELLI